MRRPRLVAVANTPVGTAVREVREILAREGIACEMVSDTATAIRRIAADGGPDIDCVLLDAESAASTGNPQRFRKLIDKVRELHDADDALALVVVAPLPPARLVTAAFRAGVYDFIDMNTTGRTELLGTIERARARSALQRDRRLGLAELRHVADEFLRILVKVERRSLDLEAQIHTGEPFATEIDEDSGTMPAVGPPRVLVADDDSDVGDHMVAILSEAGLRAESVDGGKPAVEVVAMRCDENDPIDLVIVNKNMPDLDGFDCIRQIREQQQLAPEIMIMTGFATAESAIGAADLGVAGYLVKPLDDSESIAQRVWDIATNARNQRRERHYLARIKERHATFLLRYRKLAAQLDKLL